MLSRHRKYMASISALVLLCLVVAACAPPGTIKKSGMSEHTEELVPKYVPVKSAVDRARYADRPAREKEVGKDKNKAILGELIVEDARIAVATDRKSVEFVGKANVLGRHFDVRIAGRFKADGTAAMFPVKVDPSIPIRGRAVCVDFKDGRYNCDTLFVDVYVEIQGKRYTDQYQLNLKGDVASDDDSAKTPVVSPDASANSDAGQEAGPLESVHADDSKDEWTPPPAKSNEDEEQIIVPSTNKRYVGFPNQVEDLFEEKPPKDLPVVIVDREGLKEVTEPTDKKTDPSPAKDSKDSKDPKDKKQESPPEDKSGQETLPEPPIPPPAPPVQAKDVLVVPKEPKKPVEDVPAPSKPPKNPSKEELPLPPPVAPPAPPKAPAKPAAKPEKAPEKAPVPAEVRTEKLEPEEANPDLKITPVVSTKEQSVGCTGSYRWIPRKECRTLGSLINASALDLKGVGYYVQLPTRKMYFGTDRTVGYVRDIGKLVTKLIPGYSVSVGDLSGPRGGKSGARKDEGHLNGMEADIAYVTVKPTNPWPVLVNGGGVFNKRLMHMDEQWKVFKAVVSKNLVGRIFVHRSIKRGFCQLAKDSHDASEEGHEALRRLWHAEGHENHFHLRLKCPSTSPRCLDDDEPPNKTGC
jgi:penicillin-insensitive murein endopeptidase